MIDAQQIVEQYGAAGLLVISFIAATIVPFSSEVAVFAALKLGMSPVTVLATASIGNCLGVTLNYALGRWGSATWLDKRRQNRSVERVMQKWERFGKWSLLGSWLPVIGDPLTFVAGVLKVDFLFFALVAFGTRVLRYAIIVWAV